MKTISLPVAAATLLLWSVPATEISAVSQPQLDGALGLALAGTALVAAGFAWRRRHEATAAFPLEPAFAQPAFSGPQSGFFKEADRPSPGFGTNGFGGAEVIEFTRARRLPGEAVREDGLPPVLGARLERQLAQRAARVCGRYIHREE